MEGENPNGGVGGAGAITEASLDLTIDAAAALTYQS
jgi:hypothetical protein